MGGVQPTRDHPPRRHEGHRRRCRSRFIEPDEAKHWVDDYYATLESDECVPGGFAVNPNLAVVLPLMCHDDEETAIDRGLDGGHFFGYSLAHYYVFGDAPARASPTCGHEFSRTAPTVRLRPRVAARRDQALGAQLIEQGLGSLRGAIGTPAPDPGAAPGLRGRRRRPGDLRQPGRPQPPRGHLRVAGAVRAEVMPEFHDRDEEGEGEAGTARAGDGRRPGPPRARAAGPA